MGKAIEGLFNVGVGAIIENKNNGKILLAKRSTNVDYEAGMWEDITGRVKQSESPETALKREIKEETGIDAEIIKPIRVLHMFRGEKKTENELILIIYWCRTKSEHVELSHEHDDYKWLTPAEALELVTHEGVRKDIEIFVREKSRHQ